MGLALWPFRKRRKKSSSKAEGKKKASTDQQQLAPIARTPSLQRVTRRNSRRASSRRSSLDPRVRDISYASDSTTVGGGLPDFPLPPTSGTLEGGAVPFQPQKVARNGISSYFSEHGFTITDSSASSPSSRPRKVRIVDVKLSKRKKGRNSLQTQELSYFDYPQQETRPIPGRENDRPYTAETGIRRSFGSVDSKFSARAYKVRALDVLAPRPTLRYDVGAITPGSGRSFRNFSGTPSLVPTRSNSRRAHSRASPNSDWRYKGPAADSGSFVHTGGDRVNGLADELDAHAIKELMERDQRRRSQRKRAQEEAAQKILERRAAKQREEEAARMAGYGDGGAPSGTGGTYDYDMVDVDGTGWGSEAHAGYAVTAPLHHEEDRQTTLETPHSWYNDKPSVDDVHREYQQSHQQYDDEVVGTMEPDIYDRNEESYHDQSHDPNFLHVQELRHVQGQTPGAHIPKEVAVAMNAIETGSIQERSQEYDDEMRDTITPAPVRATGYRHSDSSNSQEPHSPSQTRPISIPQRPTSSSRNSAGALNQYHSSRAGSPETGRRSAMSASLASIDSEEGHWFSSKINPRLSGNTPSPLRGSASSLARRRYLGHEDDRDNEGSLYGGAALNRTRSSLGQVASPLGGARLDLEDASSDEDISPQHDDESPGHDPMGAHEIWQNTESKSDIMLHRAPEYPQPASGLLNNLEDDSDDEDARTAVKVGGETTPVASELPTPSDVQYQTPLEFPISGSGESTPREYPYPRIAETPAEQFQTPYEQPGQGDYIGSARWN